MEAMPLAVVDTPFSISPNPNTLHITGALKAVLHKVRYTVDKRQGLTCVLGDIGLGKSTVVRFLHSEYDAKENVTTTLIPTPVFPSDFAMLKAVCNDFGIPAKRSLYDQQQALQAFLIDHYKDGKNVVLFIDEAQKLDNKMLELIRAMLNLENHKHKLMQIVLSGQLELRDRLLADKNKALYSRIFAPSLLAPLSLEETAAMIDYRCQVSDIENPFSAETIDRIYEITNGVPRNALKLCALSYALLDLAGEKKVGLALLDAAVAEGALA
jgi:general secretion pathway protein A